MGLVQSLKNIDAKYPYDMQKNYFMNVFFLKLYYLQVILLVNYLPNAILFFQIIFDTIDQTH